MAELPALSEKWRASKIKMLLEILGPGSSESDLNLAINSFQCTACRKDIPYPQVLVHRCHLRGGQEQSNDLRNCFFILGAKPWRSLECLSPRYQHSRQILVQKCGLDPASATRAELIATDALVEFSIATLPTRRRFGTISYAACVTFYLLIPPLILDV
jgi:hypothetical protein